MRITTAACVVFLFLVAPGPLVAQNLVALASVPPGDRKVGLVNTTTGAVTLPGPGVNGGIGLPTSSGVNSYDAGGNRLFFVGSPVAGDTLYSVHAGTGVVLASRLLSGVTTTILGIQYDAGEGVLYAQAAAPGFQRQLATINLASGVVAYVPGSSPIGAIGSPSGADDLDATGNRYFFAGTPSGGNLKLYSISTVNGSVLTSPDITGAVVAVLGLEWDPGESTLYALTTVSGGDCQIARINVTTGVVTKLGTPIAGGPLNLTSGNDSLDTAGNRYLFTGTPSGGSPKLYAISTVTGGVLASPNLSGGSTTLFGLEWDAGPVPVELSQFSIE